MSSTNRKQRTGTDTYYTPPWCVHRVIEALPLPGGCWIDAGAGEGQIIRAVKEKRDDIVWAGMELRSEAQPSLEKEVTVLRMGDFLTLTTAEHRSLLMRISHKPRYDVLIMNPPFNLAFEFLQLALSIADNVLMLQRLNFFGSRERSAFFRSQMPDTYVLPNRPIFNGKSGDSIEYSWFHWGPEVQRYRSKGAIEILAETPLEARGTRKPRKPRLTPEKAPKGHLQPLPSPEIVYHHNQRDYAEESL